MAVRRSPMEPGERDRLITIEQVADTVDASGAPVETWTTLATNVFAGKFDIGGRERLEAAQLAAAYDTRWEIGYRADMDADLVDVPKRRRLIYQGRTYDIVAASNIHGREGVELMTLSRSGS